MNHFKQHNLCVTGSVTHIRRNAGRCFDDVGVLALQILAPFAIGFAVFVCHLCAIPLDGCSINRALANIAYADLAILVLRI